MSIALEREDDPQVIFETLNGRGAELDATDLIRNFVFMRADREGADAAELYDTLWRPFESSFWVEKQRRGRLSYKRLEWFAQTALQAELADEVEIGKLYANYRRYGLGNTQPVPAATQLRMLSNASDLYRQLISGSGDSPVARFGRQIAVWDASPTHAVVLRIGASGLSETDQTKIFGDIISYVVRRSVCGLSPKNYNKVFLQLLRRLAAPGASAETLHAALSELTGSASRWPKDDEFRSAWLTAPAHARLGDTARVRAILTELENGLRTPHTEEPFVAAASTLDIDHIMPETWYEHWPLNGEAINAGEASLARVQLFDEAQKSSRLEAIVRREDLKATFGNLTLVHYGVNRSLQNAAFPAKRERLFAESNLHLNRTLMRAEHWDETSIEQRGRDLFEVARMRWRGPGTP